MTEPEAAKEKYVVGRLRQLGFEISQLADSAEWRAWLEVKARFPSYSLYNTMLVYAQCPTAVEVQGYVAWQKIGRQVREGKGSSIKIMAPNRRRNSDGEEEVTGFRFVSVFDYSVTDPQPLITKIDRKTGKVVTIFKGTPYERIEYPLLDDAETGALLPALLTTLDQIEGTPTVEFGQWSDMGGARGRYYQTRHHIQIRDDLPDAQLVGTLLHELGHAYDPKLQDDNDRARREHVAESVAWLAAADMGIDKTDQSSYYLTSWQAGEEELLAISKRVTSAYRKVHAIADAALITHRLTLEEHVA